MSASLGKVPVSCNDYPGFVANRILMPMINEAIIALHEGVAGVEEIDTIMKLGMAHPMGPLQLADFIGLDVCLSILNVLYDGLGNTKYAPCPLLVNMVTAGKKGVKSGEGFYDYSEGVKNAKSVNNLFNTLTMKLHAIAAALLSQRRAFAQVDLINKVKDNGADAPLGYEWETIVDIEATPVKNQGASGTCWSYATTSFVESEMIRMGKEPIDISEMYTVRKVYQDKGEKYVRLHGYLNFAQGGALPDVLYVIKHYGAVPQEVYSGLNYGTKSTATAKWKPH
jgi:hypothetical protein